MSEAFMNMAIKEAFRGMNRNEGGPFGAVIVQKGRVMAKAHNRVISAHDPTAHAEILAIRKAAKKLGRFNLSDCAIYSTCEPCPMCLSAIHWAKMKKLYFGCSRKDAARIGFDDDFIYQVIKGTAARKQVVRIQMNREDCLRLMSLWQKKSNRVQY